MRDEAQRRGWRLFRHVLWRQKRLLGGGIAAGLIWTVGRLSIPIIVAYGIDHGIVRGSGRALLMSVVALVCIGMVSAVCAGFRRYAGQAAAWRVEADLRGRVYAHLQRLHLAFHDSTQTGLLMSRSVTDLLQIQQPVVGFPMQVANIVQISAVTVVLVLINPRLALYALGSLPLLLLASKAFSTRLQPLARELQQELAGLASVVEESVSGIRAVKGFGAEAVVRDRLQERTNIIYGLSLRMARVRASFSPLIDFFPALGLVAVLWFGGRDVLAGRLTIGELVEFNYYLALLVFPLRMTGMVVAQVQRAIASAGLVDRLLDVEPHIVDAPHAVELRDARGEVTFDGVFFGYQANSTVLNDFSFSVHPGEVVALVGATGSGKSTTAALIPRFYDVDAGRILLDGHDVRDLTLPSLRRAIGTVFEETFLFTGTIRENIAFGDPSASAAAVAKAAALAGAAEFIDQLPEGYDTIVGERGLSLSGGQRQRLALARAIVADPSVLILDDATSAVDPTKEKEIRTALVEVMKGRTTLLIAHRAATIALASRVALLDHGRIVAEGTHDELLATSQRYREILAAAGTTSAAGTANTDITDSAVATRKLSPSDDGLVVPQQAANQ